MPKISEKAVLLKDIDSALFQAAKWSFFSDGDDTEDEVDDLVELHHAVSSVRYLAPRLPVMKLTNFRSNVHRYDPDRFRQAFRMDQTSFNAIVRLIEGHPVFHNNSLNPQQDVSVQLYVALRRFGHYGSSCSIGETAKLIGISEGSVLKYTERVTKALLSLESEFIRWPDASKRQQISRRLNRKFQTLYPGCDFPGCIGFVDGTHIPFAVRPAVDGEVFWTRKHTYAMNTQLVCDETLRILFYQTGWAGSVHDAKAFKHTSLFRNPAELFSNGEFILGDSAYPLSPNLLTPYRNAAGVNRDFNFRHANMRVSVEHLMGALKGRWQSLKELRCQVKKKSDLSNVNNWIRCCYILHNILIELSDVWDIDGAEPAEAYFEGEAFAHGDRNEFREHMKGLMLGI
jgi:hypothetical protein